MTTTRTGTGPLLAVAAVLAAAGALLLHSGLGRLDGQAPTVRPTSVAAPTTDTSPVPYTGGGSAPLVESASARPTVVSAPPRHAAPAPSGSAPPNPPPRSEAGAPAGADPARGELPPPGEGPAADPLIQQVLDRATPADLPPADERLLLDLARAAWLKETAGYTQVRIQAAVARRDTPEPPAPDAGFATSARAVVRLVWAGADRAGTFQDGRPASLHYHRNGDASWTRT
ncbi:hypothetical protein [Streptomyces sp. RerS4]|uniref:hypothetical protein n=1 Tax=Streptomyces sp. RerS4 TaxID=2942449 RepID=UPI00201C8D45|nr:hypothetical protein [Streptomyces sp. RerS4]UQW99126.1 hypothetical protein M4D82_00155 [Streptomyces sp. RerS4]